MSKRIRLTIALCILQAGGCFPAAAQSGTDTGDEAGKIMALETAWNQAEVQHDRRAMDMLLADAFEYTDFDGTYMNKQQWLDLLKKDRDQYEELGNLAMAVHVYGTVAIVTGGYRQRLKSKKNAPVRIGRFTDVWVLQSGLWKCVASQATIVSAGR